MVEAGVSIKRAQEILGHASERTTLSIYTHTMRRQSDDTADKIAVLAGLASADVCAPRGAAENVGDKRETFSDPDSAKVLQLVELMALQVGLTVMLKSRQFPPFRGCSLRRYPQRYLRR
jgi:hypothetical protein